MRVLDMTERLSILEKVSPLALTADGFDAAIVGTFNRDGTVVVLYDIDLCIDALQTQGITDRSEAEEYFYFNTYDAYVGIGTPEFC